MSAIQELYESLSVQAIRGFVETNQEEHLNLDFKCTQRTDLSRRDDRRIFAKAVSGFANSSGGLIVWGVDARRNDDEIDCACDLRPVESAVSLVASLNSFTGVSTSPTVNGVVHRALKEDEDAGFAVSFVPESSRGPHMAKLGEDRYYKRSGDSFYKMEHFDIADMFGRRRRTHLVLDGNIDKVQGDRFVSLLLSIRNEGRGSAMAPFLRISLPTGCQLDGYGVDGNRNFGLPQNPPDGFGRDYSFGGRADVLVHPSVTLDVVRVNVARNFRTDLEIVYSIAASDVELAEGTLVIPHSEITKYNS